MQDLIIGLVQTNTEWHNPEANRHSIAKKIHGVTEKVDLFVLPEMFTTGFTMDVESNSEVHNGITGQWMQELASTTGANIAGSIIIQENNKYYNRLYWVKPNGEITHYDKRHLFRMANEEKHFTEGNNQVIIDLNGWKIKPLICYDLRFPVWSRNTNLSYDVLLYVANWPQLRIDAWDALLKARAIENLCYSVGVNRIGKDGTNKTYNGHSACYNYKGQLLNNLSEDEQIIFLTLSKPDLLDYRDKFPANLDADLFTIDK